MHYIFFKILFFLIFFQTILLLISTSLGTVSLFKFIESYWNWSFEVSFWTLMNSSTCKYSPKVFANWFVNWSFMIDKKEGFVFWIRASQSNETPTSTTNYPGLLWQRGYWIVQYPGDFWSLQGKSILCIAGFDYW